MGAARDIGKRLVDRDPFDEWRVITQNLDGGVGQPLVLREMAADKSQLRTELARSPARHTATDPEGLGFIRSGEHNTTPHSDRPAAQRRVEQLLDRGIEGVQIRVEDRGSRVHTDPSPSALRSADGWDDPAAAIE